MAGPSMIGIRDVINPVEGLQDSVSRVGDIYRNYEQDRRASQLHTEQMAEFERAENARQYLRNYTPELGGGDFKGIDSDTKKAMILEERKILESLGPDASPDEHRRITDEFTRRRAQLVTREAVTADMYNDLVRNNIDSETAKNLAAIEGAKYESLDDRVKSSAESVKAAEERANKRAEIAINAMKARKATRIGSDNSTERSANSAEKGTPVLDTNVKLKKFLDDTISGPGPKFESNTAFGHINSALALANEKRIATGKRPLSLADISNLVSYSVTSGEWNNDAVFNSSGEWQQAIETYANSIDNNSSRNSGGGGSNAVVPTADEERAIITALRGVNTTPQSRAEIAAKRVRGVYGDLYKTLKTTEATEDSGIRILGGTGNSGQRKGSGNSQNTGTAGGSSTSNTGNTNTNSKNTTTQESRLLPVNESPLPPELAERKEDTQARIRAITNKPGGRSQQDAIKLRKLESRLKDIEEQENALREERSRPKVEAAYKAAVDARVGTNVPEDLYTSFSSALLKQYPTDQLRELEGKVAGEHNNYRAVLAYAELTGDRRAASDARSRMLKLRKVSEYIDRKLGRTRLPE